MYPRGEHCLGSLGHVDLRAGCLSGSHCGLGKNCCMQAIFKVRTLCREAVVYAKPFHLLKASSFRSHLCDESCQEWPLQRELTQIVTSFRPGKPLQDKQEAITQHNVFSLGTSKQVLCSVQSSESKSRKLVLAQCDPKIKSNGMSLLIQSLKIWFGRIFRLKR